MKRPLRAGGYLVSAVVGATGCGSSAATNAAVVGGGAEAGGGLVDDASDSGAAGASVGDAMDRASDAVASGADGTSQDAAPLTDGPDGTGSCILGEVFSPPCNAIAPSGPLVGTTCASGTAPQPQGGTVVDGTYILESGTWYGSCPGVTTIQTTLIVCGGVWNSAQNSTSPDAAVQTLRVNYTAAVEDAAVALNPICTTGSPLAGGLYSFSVSGTRLTTMTSYGSSVFVRVYKWQ